MAEQHRHKLIPTSKSPRMPFRFRLFHCLLKIHSRKNLEQLIQNAAKSLHGADSSSLIAVLDPHCRSYTEVQPLFDPLFSKPNLDSSALKRRGGCAIKKMSRSKP